MPSSEMVEKARAWFEPELLKRNPSAAINPQYIDAPIWMAEFAESAVREAVSELDTFTIHGPDCAHYHAMNPANKRCDCGLAALRKKYGVADGGKS